MKIGYGYRMINCRLSIILCSLFFVLSLTASECRGIVCDGAGLPVMYATVYLRDNPQVGTATNAQGLFVLDVPPADTLSPLTVSFVGCEKIELSPDLWRTSDTLRITLREQPIDLQETVVAARKTRLSRRKQLAHILREVYLKLDEQWPRRPVRYTVVSDVRMDAQEASWGMEELVATVVEIPDRGVGNKDSIQFRGEYCKRYCAPAVRMKIDSVMLHETDPQRVRMAVALDSGTLTHRALWHLNLHRDRIIDTGDELSRWQVGREDDTRTVLTYTRTHNFLGIVKAQIAEHLIVDSYDFTLESYSADLRIRLSLPFSIRLKGTELEWLNLINMSNKALDKFRLKRGEMHVRVSTLYSVVDGVLVPTEKNMRADAVFRDRNGTELPCRVSATQHVTRIETRDVVPLLFYRKNALVPRTLVPVY